MVYYEKGIVVKTAAPAVLMPLPKISHVSQFVRHRNYFIDVFQKNTSLTMCCFQVSHHRSGIERRHTHFH
jgi:hypothetical protein